MTKSNGIDLGSGSVKRLMLKLIIPTVTAQIISLLYTIVDRMYIGKMPVVGDLALTGVGIAFPIITLILAFSSLIATGAAARASISMGGNDYDKAENILGNSFTLLIGTSIVMTILLIIFGEDILLLFGGASDNTIQYAMDYLHIYVLGTIFVQLTLGINTFITCQGFTSVSMKTILIGAILNIVLDPIFIYVLNLGVKGAAIATIISQAVSAVWVMIFITGNKTLIKLKFKYLKLNPKIFMPTLALGLSPFIMQSTESILNACFNFSLYKYGGDLAVGAMVVLSSISTFAYYPMVGMTMGTQPIISYNFGAKKPERVKEAFKTVLIACCVCSGFIWCLTTFTPELLIKIFNDKPELVDLTSSLTQIYFAVYIILGIQIACQQTLIALGKAKASMILALLRKVILLIPLIFILPNVFDGDKVMLVMLAEPISDFIAVVSTVIVFAIVFKKLMTDLQNSILRDQANNNPND